MTKLSADDREKLAELLLRGEPVPRDFKHRLFPPDRQEYELVYADKQREEEILADVMSVPLQSIREFGGPAEDWRNQLIFGDNLQTLRTLVDQKREGKLANASGEPGVQLIYIDPPFASKRDFAGNQQERAYRDKIVGAQFLEFLRRRLVLLRELLADNGSIFVHIDAKKGHYVKVLMDEIFGEHNFRNEIVCHYYNKMQGNVKRFASDHDVILWYSKSSIYTFKALKEKRAEGSVQQIKRVWSKEQKKLVNMKDARGRVVYQETDEKTVDDVWRISMLQPADRTQNLKYPTQKPEAVIARVVEAASNPGDIVLDAFAGSGTTAAVSEKLGRRWIAIDCGKLAIYTVQKRMLSLKSAIGNRGKPLPVSPFSLYNAGLYDFATLRDLQWGDWRFFALSLFSCKDDPHTVRGVHFDGYRQGADVLVFDHRQHGGVVLDHGFVENLHLEVGSAAGSSVFIIAPAASIVFLEDYIDKGETRYYILRIPYSIINELHERPFEALLQPVDESQVNYTVEAVGFDFIKQPDVSCTYGRDDGPNPVHAQVRVDSFKSEALARGVSKLGDREALAAVLVDYDYPFERSTDSAPAPAFEMDEVFYATAIEANDWKLSFPLKRLGEYVMIVYVDVYGNEFVEVKRRDDFSAPLADLEGGGIG